MERKLRRCSKCKKHKELTEFYFQRSNGFWTSRCKRCNNKMAVDFINSRPVEVRRKMWREQSAKTHARHPEKLAARVATRAAIKKGTLKKLPCEVCGEEKVQAHHNDYAKPLEVRFLCHLHHRMIHYPHAYETSL